MIIIKLSFVGSERCVDRGMRILVGERSDVLRIYCALYGNFGLRAKTIRKYAYLKTLKSYIIV